MRDPHSKVASTKIQVDIVVFGKGMEDARIVLRIINVTEVAKVTKMAGMILLSLFSFLE